MWKHIETYNRLKRDLFSEKSKRMTMRKDIFKELGYDSQSTINPTIAKSTAEIKLNTFQDCMIYVQNFENRNTYTKGSVSLPFTLTPMLWNVHYRMYIFMTDNKFMKITYNGYDNYKFSWNIPESFMPILGSYIFACNFPKGETASSIDFFEAFDSKLESRSSTKKYSDDYQKFIVSWAILQLGREYFYNFETNIPKLTGTNKKRAQQLRNDLSFLTDVQTYCKNSSGIISIYAARLLLHFFKQCNTTKNLELFAHEQTIIPQAEKNLILDLLKSFQNKLNTIICFVNNCPKNQSLVTTFPIAVADYKAFEKEFQEYFFTLATARSYFPKYIENFYDIMHGTILAQINNGSLNSALVNGSNLKSHAIFLIQEFTSAYNALEIECKRFNQKVNLVSQGNINKRENMEIALYKLSDFEKSLQEIFMKLSEKTAENKIKSLPPYIKYISDGKHLDFAFPPHIESREYATLLLKKIYPATHPLSEDVPTTLSIIYLSSSIKKYFKKAKNYIRPTVLPYTSLTSIPHLLRIIKPVISLKEFLEILSEYEYRSYSNNFSE